MNPATGKPKAEIAHMLVISRQHLHDILAERKPVSAEVAVRLAKLGRTGVPPRPQTPKNKSYA